MNPERVYGFTNILAPPENWNPQEHGDCVALAVRVAQDAGLISIASAWRPTPEELVLLNAGGVVVLNVLGRSHPAVSLAVEQGEYYSSGASAEAVDVDTDIPVRTCRECKCTDTAACPGGCYWVEPDLCSACAPESAP